MKDKVVAFVRQSISNQKRALAKYDAVLDVSEDTAALYASQVAKMGESLEIWETMFAMILGQNTITEDTDYSNILARKDYSQKLTEESVTPPDRLVGANKYNLSKAELRILRHVSEGDPNKVIAHKLGITEATTKVHVRNILKSVGLKNRTQLALFAVREGLV